MVHTLDRTPTVSLLTPNRGTARGGTSVTVSGSKLEPLGADGNAVAASLAAANTRIIFNSYACDALSANGTAVMCTTTERDRGITPHSTEVWLAGRGRAIVTGIGEDTTFKYVDKWSNVYSWADSEPPVDGDTVIVPEGQAIMLDTNSPKLFLLLITGYFEFDRKDLTLDATYIWIAGGKFYVGTEEAPFLQRATITLHGSRWDTIELPIIGSKMLVVTDLGGLGTCNTRPFTLRLSSQGKNTHDTEPCPVQQVGRLELHGKPGVSWTRLVETAAPGSTFLKLEEAVNWEVGANVVITPSHRGQEEEVRGVKSLQDGGLTVELDEPVAREHLGIWYYHDDIPTPTDLRAAVGLLNRNVKVQGDESTLSPGNSYMFGAHIGAFHGGVMRIENTELTRTGQSANFGRYTSHWHHLSPHRTIDVADVAYIRNNTMHDTFQRATVVHSTDFAVVRDNVAHRTKGHSFFTEVGDEVFALFEHNLAVHPLQHPLLLDDDMDPAGFWIPGFTGWHRNNLAANAHRGWRVRKLSEGPGLAPRQTDLTFFNNSAHACGFGWHLKPPHAPPTLNNFLDFTAFRCSTGMFYYGTGNIYHDNHRMIECGTGHFQNHLFNNLHTWPFFHNWYLVGNINPNQPWANSGLGDRTPKDNEYYYISGLTVINYHSTPVLFGCHETACTIRLERTKWINSTRYTRSDTKLSGIYWDMDGTMTGYRNGFVSMYTKYLDGLGGKCSVQPEHVNGVVCGKADGSLRLRRLLVNQAQPWQLDGKEMNVWTLAGFDRIQFDFKKLYGWAIPAIENETYDIKPNDANDWQTIKLTWSTWPYVMQEHGFRYTRTTPMSEAATVHLNYTDWRDHFDAAYGSQLGRMPTREDPWGSYSMMLWPHQCSLYNFSNASQALCDRGYTPNTSLEFLAEMNSQPTLPMINGRLTTALTMKVVNNSGSYSAGPGTPSNWQQFTPRECPEGGCPRPVVNPGELGPKRLWSVAAGWPNGQLPVANDNVVLSASDHVEVDIETPRLHVLTVEGKLTFSRTVSTKLRTGSIKVWGTVDMGTVESPIPSGVTAEIELYGDEQAHTVVMSEGLFLVNKVVAVLGKITAVGSPTSGPAWSRLASTAEAGATQLAVRGDLSGWPSGAKVGISATEFPSPPRTTQTEDRVLTTSPVFDAATGISTLTLDRALTHRHFAGQVDNSAENTHWPQPTLAAAVALLEGRSNVIFRTGEGDLTDHGGELVIAGTADNQFIGEAQLQNVDFIKMGKAWYQAPAVKFNFLGGQASGNLSRLERCVFSESHSGGIEAEGASKLELIENVFYKTTRSAVWLLKASAHDAIVLRRNIAIETLRYARESTAWVRNFASFFLEVRPKELVGNIAAGSTDGGFMLRPRLVDCSSGPVSGYARLQEDDLNEAVGCMTGVFVLRACSMADCAQCAEVRGFVAWKNSHAGLITADQNANMMLDTVLLADNHIGITMHFVRSRMDVTHRIYTQNVSVFGSTNASTCADSTECRALGREDVEGKTCNSVIGNAYRRVGIMTHIINSIGKLCETQGIPPVCRPPTTPAKPCVMPWEHRLGSLGSRYSEAHWANITFGHFKASDCGRSSVAFTYNPTGIDTSFPQIFSGVKWLPSAEESAKVFLGISTITHNRVTMSPDYDGTNMAVATDLDGSLLGSSQAGGSLVTTYNPGLAKQACTEVPGFYNCPSLKLRYLKWEPVGEPENRVLSKFKVWRESDSRSTWSTGPFNDGCIPDPPDLDRHWFISPGDFYNLTMFTTPPKHHRLYWFNDESSDSMRLDIFLTQPFRLEVYVDGVVLPENTYDTYKKATRLPVLTDPHGSYTFDPHARRFYLIMRGGYFDNRPASRGAGFVLLRLLKVVQLSLAVSVPMADFEGPAMVNNIATLLKIDPSRIKIVSVQTRAQVAASQGGRLLSDGVSVVFQIIEANPEPIPGEALSEAGVEAPAGVVWNITPSTAAKTSDSGNANLNGTNASGESSSSTDASTLYNQNLAELTSLAELLQNASQAGTLSSALQVPVTLEELELSDNLTTTTTTMMVEANETGNGTTSTTVTSKSRDLLFTRNLTLDGDYASTVTDKAQFLSECSVVLAPATCVDVQPGSIILTLGGASLAVLDQAASDVSTQGLVLPTFGTLRQVTTTLQQGIPTNGPEPEVQEEDTSVVSILVGAAVGCLVGTMMMGIGIWVKSKYFPATDEVNHSTQIQPIDGN
eukprot:TRINITY_DN1691_c0_g3_i1.p1 TRINITY_DN1691_c0_g3~~TRINITY_DN1691_c0_g3_i1.p1  ORF type:complete len:2461 (+),score=365.35 TRINITY_DN1691_c0_g3_i1:773-7384(+)